VTNFVQRGIRGRRPDAASVLGWAAALGRIERTVSEAPVRGFWKGWRETMEI
jgi:hypothetical protein